MQVTVFSTFGPSELARASGATPVQEAAWADYAHLVSSDIVMRHFLTDQANSGIRTSICLVDQVSSKVFVTV